MSKKRRRKRKLKPFAKVLFTFTIILLLAGGTYYIYKDSSSQNINKDNNPTTWPHRVEIVNGNPNPNYFWSTVN